MANDPLIILTAAEASGDQHAANLAIALRERIPGVRLVAFGGPRLAAAGVELLADLSRGSAMLLGAIRRVPQMIGRLIQFDRFIKSNRPALHITVDSPAANLPVAGRSKAHCVPVLAYVAPQLWAWGNWRMAKVRRRVDRVACILPFEPDYFRPHGIAAEFVGHPIFEPLVNFQPDAARIAKLKLPGGSQNLKIALLPGSRAHVISHHLPAQLRVAAAIKKNHPTAEFVVATPPPGHGHSLNVGAILAAAPTPITWASQLDDGSSVGIHDVLTWADLVLTASGSVTLEVAWFAKPMVVMYYVPPWQWHLLGRWVLRAQLRSLPNIVAGRKVVPEFMPWFGQDQPIIDELESLIADPARQEAMRADLRALVQPLAAQHASRRVAEIAAEMIQSSSAHNPPPPGEGRERGFPKLMFHVEH